MKIDHLETIHLRFEYEDGFTYAGGKCTARVTTLVLVHTDTGETGIGAAYSHPGMVDLVVNHQFNNLLRGHDPRQIDDLWSYMYGITRWYGRKGAAMSALGAIDTACWDLRGKDLGKPVWSLLGGSEAVCPAYASGLLWQPAESLAREAEEHIANGFRRVKMRLGLGPEEDVECVSAVRNAIGPDNDVLVDGSMRYSVESARTLGKVLDDLNVFWYEEPFTPEDIDSFVELRGTVDVPLAAGENEFGVQGFRELIRAGALDIVQPDCCRCGGISEVYKVGKMAQEAGVRFATHTWSDAVAVVANAHVVSALPNGITVEVDRTGNPFIDQLLVEPLSINDGLLALSDAPGLGVELRQETIDKYRLEDPFNVPDGAYSDMVFGKAHYNPAAPYE